MGRYVEWNRWRVRDLVPIAILLALTLACLLMPTKAHAQTASISVTFTNSWDDSTSGIACVKTEIRYFAVGVAVPDTLTAASKLALWDLMTAVPAANVPPPGAPGTPSTVVIPGFTPGRYWINVRQKDDGNNWSGMSNFLERFVTDTVRPAPVRVWP